MMIVLSFNCSVRSTTFSKILAQNMGVGVNIPLMIYDTDGVAPLPIVVAQVTWSTGNH